MSGISEEPSRKENALARTLRLVRFSHTIFALPFALAALLVATGGRPSGRVLVLVLLCMVFARTSAMLFNRLADWSIDQRNPRTAGRHRLIPRSAAITLLVLSSMAFIGSATAINWLTALLSPVALLIVFFYSWTKRFTDFSHFFLGIALAIAPIGAWIAARGTVSLPPMVLAAGVVCWVAGFDLIYAAQDMEFDRKEKLHSLMVRLGLAGGMQVARILHAITLVALLLFGVMSGAGAIYYSGLGMILGALVYEHFSLRGGDLALINTAFFWSNAFVSTIFVVTVWLDLVL